MPSPQRQPPSFSLHARSGWFSQTHPRPRQNGHLLSVTAYPASAACSTCPRCAAPARPRSKIPLHGLLACRLAPTSGARVLGSLARSGRAILVSSGEARPTLGGMGGLEAGRAGQRSAARLTRGFKLRSCAGVPNRAGRTTTSSSITRDRKEQGVQPEQEPLGQRPGSREGQAAAITGITTAHPEVAKVRTPGSCNASGGWRCEAREYR